MSTKTYIVASNHPGLSPYNGQTARVDEDHGEILIISVGQVRIFAEWSDLKLVTEGEYNA